MQAWRKYLTCIVLLLAVLALGGCGTSLQVVKQEFARSDKCWDPNTVTVSEMDTSVSPVKMKSHSFAVAKDGFFNPEYLKAIKKGTSDFDPFLDCFFDPNTPAGSKPPITTPSTDLAKLYRGYLTLALFANYGAYNIEIEEYDSQINDAAGLLARIVEAQTLIISPALVSPVDPNMKKRLTNPLTSDQQKSLEKRLKITPKVERLRRVLQIIEVYIQSERPTYERLRGHLTGIPSLGTFFSPSALKQMGKLALVGLKKSANLTHYSKAYIEDVKNKLSDIKSAGWKVEVSDWEEANTLVVQACDRLAVVAEVSSHQCGLN